MLQIIRWMTAPPVVPRWAGLTVILAALVLGASLATSAGRIAAASSEHCTPTEQAATR